MSIFVILLFLQSSTYASLTEPKHQIEIIPEQSSVEFLAVGRPSAIKIRGEKGKPEGSILLSNGEKVSGQFKVNLEDFSTGISLRDKHMKEKYLETQKEENRFAVLEITKLNFPSSFWNNSTGGDFQFTGTLYLHGVKKEINGILNIEDRKKESFQGKTRLTVKLNDFNIEVPKFSGITVAETVEIEVKFLAKTNLAQ